ncbi:SycD/LcrH family type III secretion system chaperone [Achromobacter marplatensis]|uniref:SycD/LcrH family type III secretion system chaperone n=1 Tax=Achromobacter marplatensis TaxID=470868 RepID=UPI0039F64F6B
MPQANSARRTSQDEVLYAALAALPSSQRFSSAQLEVIYGLAYAHVVQKKYEQALPVFAFLAQYGPTRKHYWAGMALCLNMAGRHEEAASIYTLNSMLFPDSPDSTLHVAECQIAAGMCDQAQITLNQVLQESQASPDHAEIGRRAQALMKLAAAPMAA